MSRTLTRLVVVLWWATTLSACSSAVRSAETEQELDGTLAAPPLLEIDLAEAFGETGLAVNGSLGDIRGASESIPSVPLPPGDVHGPDLVAAYALPAEIHTTAVSIVEDGFTSMLEAIERGGVDQGTLIRNGDHVVWQDVPTHVLRAIDEPDDREIDFMIDIVEGDLTGDLYSLLSEDHQIELTAQIGEDVYQITLFQNDQSRRIDIRGSIVRDGTTWYMDLRENGDFLIDAGGELQHDLDFSGSLDGDVVSIDVSETWRIVEHDDVRNIHRTLNSAITRGTDRVNFKHAQIRMSLENGRPAQYQAGGQDELGWSASGDLQRDGTTEGSLVMEFAEHGGTIELFIDARDERVDLGWWRIAPVLPILADVFEEALPLHVTPL